MAEGYVKATFPRRKNVKEGEGRAVIFGEASVIIQTFFIPLSFIEEKSGFGGLQNQINFK